jgi:hypothetical protein
MNKIIKALVITSIASGCSTTNYYSQNPREGEKAIPGADKNISYGDIVISNVINKKEDYDEYVQHKGNAKDYKGIDAYYKNPETSYAVDVGASNVDIIPYVLPLPKITSRKIGGVYNDIFVYLNKEDVDNGLKYTIPKYKKGFSLHYLDVSSLSHQDLVVEEEPKGNNPGAYGWVRLSYPYLVSDDIASCVGAKSVDLKPYDIKISYSDSKKLSTDFFEKTKKQYIDNSKYWIHVDFSNSELCLVPAKKVEGQFFSD